MNNGVVIRAFDRCTAAPENRSPDAQCVGNVLQIREDTIYLDSRPVFRRLEPHGLGDVHWECVDSWVPEPSAARYTHLEFAL